LDLVIKVISSEWPGELPLAGTETFALGLRVEIGERFKDGAEAFHFIAASPHGLEVEIGKKGFTLMRGLILMQQFDLATIHRAIDNLINHARSLENWHEVVRFLNRYSRYDSEDLDGKLYP
jgi:hypothetical protein